MLTIIIGPFLMTGGVNIFFLNYVKWNGNDVNGKFYRFVVDASEHVSELADSEYVGQHDTRPLDLIVPGCSIISNNRTSLITAV